MDNETMLPMDWRPLREAAEVEAREAHAAWEDVIRKMGGSSFLIEETLATRAMLGVEAETDAHAALLADLRRPASRDFWARWLAEEVGLTVGATAPRWAQSDARTGEVRWRLDVGGDVGGWVIFHDGPARFGAYQVVPGIAAITDPAAALRAALLAVVSK